MSPLEEFLVEASKETSPLGRDVDPAARGGG